MSELKLHPLINKQDSPHYSPSNKKTSIEKFEEIYVVSKLMAWAEITLAKYEDPGRKDKGEEEKDLRKAETYRNYMLMLEDLVSKNTMVIEMTAKKAYALLDVKLRYK